MYVQGNFVSFTEHNWIHSFMWQFHDCKSTFCNHHKNLPHPNQSGIIRKHNRQIKNKRNNRCTQKQQQFCFYKGSKNQTNSRKENIKTIFCTRMKLLEISARFIFSVRCLLFFLLYFLWFTLRYDVRWRWWKLYLFFCKMAHFKVSPSCCIQWTILICPSNT